MYKSFFYFIATLISVFSLFKMSSANEIFFSIRKLLEYSEFPEVVLLDVDVLELANEIKNSIFYVTDTISTLPYFIIEIFRREPHFLGELAEIASAKGRGAYINFIWESIIIPEIMDIVSGITLDENVHLEDWRNIARKLQTFLLTLPWPETVFTIPDICAICQGTMLNGSELPCNHQFHGNCITMWIGEGTTTCPYCRENI